MENLKKWDAEDKDRIEKRQEELATEQQWVDEQEMRRVAECREENEKKLERDVVQRTQWRRTLMHFARANGPVALSSLGAYLMLCSNELLILYYLVSNNIIW